MPETAQQISEKPEVRKELARTTGEKKPGEKVKARGTDKFWFTTHALLVIGCGALYFFLGSKLIPLSPSHFDLTRRIIRAVALIVVVLAIAKAISVYALGRIEDAAIRFTLQRVEHLLVALLIALVAVSIIFVNWYAALTALGVGSIIIGLAVQRTMQKIVEEELGEEMMERVGVYRDLLARTPVDELEVRAHPRVIFRVDEVTWIDAIVRYLVAPREAGSTKSRLIPKLLAALNAAPEKVMFPKGDAR